MADAPVPDAGPAQDAMGIVDATETPPGDLRCCCGRPDCVFLRHNCSVLSSVERDVQTAARMGQTLLARHEAYMASAERDRLELAARIEQLERDNAHLEARNKAAADENYGLREELEHLNVTVKDAETKIELLEATLRDSQREVLRLENAEQRAVTLERQVAVLEEEQSTLRTTIARTEEEARTTMYRWREAEKALRGLQEQLERMEKEAREERERHVEVIGRMERQRAMEKELNTAAGRLKGAAAVKSMTDSRGSGNVVSHFVRDLLQDNANLQLAVAELREMLLSSNDEIQSLREQLMYHQPAGNQETGQPHTLQAELENREPPTPPQAPRVSQELHIHHHYHVAPKPESRKPRKRRHGITPGTFTPPHISVPSSPIPSAARWQRAALAAPPLTPTTKDGGMPLSARWLENQSEFGASSAPSSPRSTNRDSVFDRVHDLPSPCSPTTSVDPTSPARNTAHRKKVSELSLQGISETAMFPTDVPHAPSTQRYYPRPHPLASYTTDDLPRITSPSLVDSSTTGFDGASPGAEPSHCGDEAAPLILSPTSETQSDLTTTAAADQHHRGLRRIVSHESIMSLSNGMDIHTLKARPSQLSLRPLLGLSPPPAGTTDLSAVTARPTLARPGGAGGKRGSMILRDSMAQFAGVPPPEGTRSWVGMGKRVVTGPAGNRAQRETEPEAGGRGRDRERRGDGRGVARAPSALGKLVAWRPWAGTSASTSSGSGAGDGGGGGHGGGPRSRETSPSSTPVRNPSVPQSSSTSTSLPIPTLSLPASDRATSTATTATAAVAARGNSYGMLSKSPRGSASVALSSSPSSSVSTTTATPTPTGASLTTDGSIFRAPGINQPGVVPGFHEFWAAHQRRAPPSKVSVEGREQAGVQEALREVLDEG